MNFFVLFVNVKQFMNFYELWSKRCLLAYHSTYIALFMDLPVSSFVSHLFLLTVKSIDLAVACDGFPS